MPLLLIPLLINSIINSFHVLLINPTINDLQECQSNNYLSKRYMNLFEIKIIH